MADHHTATIQVVDGVRATKFHEGWCLHQPSNAKVWSKLWISLRGNMFFIFGSDKTDKKNLKGTLTLGKDTELKTLPPDSKKRGFKFELSTTSANGQDRKMNKFKFEKQNEHDLWKSFIVGITVGIVPSDVHLLPGQLKDVHEAIGEMRNTPPPVPEQTLRPRLPNSSPGGYPPPAPPLRDQGSSVISHRSNDSGGDSDGSGSFVSHVTQRTNRSGSVDMVHNLRQQFSHRQIDLVDRTLDTPPPPPPMDRKGSLDSSHFLSNGGQSHGYLDQHNMAPSNMQYAHDDISDTFSDSGVASGINYPSPHMFYPDSHRNSEIPTWFFDMSEDSRGDAEKILTMGKHYGNVLMRTSTSFGNTGKYVISMRREVAGGTKLDHYEVVRSGNGFKINVDNRHNPMSVLQEVMDFFKRVAGPGTQPMTTNNLDLIYGRSSGVTMSPHSPPPMSPNWPAPPTPHTLNHMEQNQWGNSMPAANRPAEYSHSNFGFEQGASRPVSLSAVPPAPPPPPPLLGPPEDCKPDYINDWVTSTQSSNDYINVPTIPEAGLKYYGMSDASLQHLSPHQQQQQALKQRQHIQSSAAKTTNPADSQFAAPNLKQPVPAFHTPSETMQRQAGHPADGLHHDFNRLSTNNPPPPPMGGGPPPPPAPPPPPMGAVPPAPPIPSGGIPPAPPMGGMSLPAIPTTPSFSPTNHISSPSQGTSRRESVGGGGGMDLQQELQSKLGRFREAVYSDGTVLKNF